MTINCFSDPVAFFFVFGSQKVGSALYVRVHSLIVALRRTSSTPGCFGSGNPNTIVLAKPLAILVDEKDSQGFLCSLFPSTLVFLDVFI